MAAADVALWSRAAPGADRTAGRVEAIAVAPAAEAAVVLVEEAEAHAGRGLAGDRYHEGRGTFSDPHGNGHDLTLVEAEVLEELGLSAAGDAPQRRHPGIDLDALVGRRFTVGGVECAGRRLCEPCAHLERLSPARCARSCTAAACAPTCSADGAIRVGDAVSP